MPAHQGIISIRPKRWIGLDNYKKAKGFCTACISWIRPPEPVPLLGARTIVATKLAERWFFLYGFRKSERANIDRDELRALQKVAKDLLGLDDRQLDIA